MAVNRKFLFFTYIVLKQFLIIIPTEVIAQNKYSLKIKICDEHQENEIKNLSYKKNFQSKYDIDKELRKVLFYFIDKAYLTAHFDSVKSDSLLTIAHLNIGNRYKWAYLKKGNLDERTLNEIKFKESFYRNSFVYYKKIGKVQEQIIEYAENHGFPFASVKLDSIKINGDSLFATINYSKNKEIKIDSIVLKGNAKISTLFLSNYLAIKPGDLYNESIIKNVDFRLKELPFVKLNNSSTILFTEKATKLILDLNKRNASQFDGYIGILPNNQTNKVIFTGDIRLKLENTISRGELFEINWRSLQKNTQDLKSKVTYPFLFSTPFGADYNFKLYKKDTIFLDVSQNLGIQYLISGGNYFKAFIVKKESNLLSTKGLEFATTLPSYSDVSSFQYGLGLKTEKLDYRLNPRKGYSININAAVGKRNIQKNSKLNQDLYKDLKLNSTQYSGDIVFSAFTPFAKKSTFKLGVQSAFVYASSLFQNELFRIGGFKSMRGIDEESINASLFSIFTAEYRYLLEQNSYLYLFADIAYYENMSIAFQGKDRDDTPISFGAGVSFETKAGIFSINYALGKQFDNPIFLKAGKIHFGIINYF